MKQLKYPAKAKTGTARTMSLPKSGVSADSAKKPLKEDVVTGSSRKEKDMRHLASFPILNPNPIIELDTTGMIHFLNPAAERLFPGISTSGVRHPIVPDLASLVTVLRKKEQKAFVREVKAGATWYEQVCYFVPKGSLVRMYCTDITERKLAEEALKKAHDEMEFRIRERTVELTKANEALLSEMVDRIQAEEALRESEERYRHIVETSQEGIWIIDAGDRITFANGRMAEMLDSTIEELSGRSFFDFVWPADRDEAREKLDRQRKGSREQLDFRLKRKDGTFIWTMVSASRRFDEQGNFAGTLGMAIDITERRRAHDAFIEQSKILEAFFRHSLTPLVFLDRDFNFIRVNEAYARACQRDESDFPGHNHFDLYPSDELRREFTRVVETKKPFQVFARPFTFPDHPEWGETYWDLSVVPVLNSGNRVEYLVFSLRDVTKYTLANAYNRSLIEASLDPLVTINADGKITDVNTATENITGLSREELIDTDFSDYFTDPGRAREGYRRVFKEGSIHDYELAIRHREGGITPVLYNGSVYRNEGGNVVGVFAAARDITERKETERRTNANNALLRLFSQIASRKEYLDAVVDLLHTWSGCRCTGIRVKDDHSQIPYESFIGFSREFWEQENLLSTEADECICIRVIKGLPDAEEVVATTPYGSFYSGDVVKFVESLSSKESARYRGTCIRHGFASLAVIPVRFRGTVLGAIHLADEKEGMVPLKVIEFIELVSPLIGEALSRFSMEDTLRSNYAALQRSEKSLAEAQRIARVGNWDWDLTTNELHWSDEVYRIYGVDPASFEKTYVAFLHYVHTDDRESVRQAIADALHEKKPYDIKHRIVLEEGTVKTVHEQGEVTFGDSGEPVRMVGTVQDITERQLQEEKLRESREQLRNLSAHLHAVREEERRSIAREIHDELGQALTALKMDISWLGNKYASHEPLVEKTKSMVKLVDSTIKTVKKISSELRPVVLDDLGLAAAIEWQANEFQKRSGIQCDVSFVPDDIVLGRAISTTVFRIFQEALTNVIRHAGATKVAVSLEERNGEVFLGVQDNGKGITEQQMTDPKSFGLIGMRERVQFFGGEIKITGTRNKGTSLAITIPVKSAGDSVVESL
jgi:PAS domain S-box-containing protein